VGKVLSFTLPKDIKRLSSLKAGDEVLLSGVFYTARDAAHKRMVDSIKAKRKLPIALTDTVLYYCGPTPEKVDFPIGSCGPTTASRMDNLTEPLLKKGLKVMVGKGLRSDKTVKAIKRHKAVYFVTYGGCGAYLNSKVKQKSCVAYSDLGPEAIYCLQVKDFPVVVGVDSCGRVLE